ncbi:dephospho-CoA kinase [Arthrobacter sp. NPDC090010]|uniref:dephospho-CoA kinase n=1 Tax=Arthrobacter sp. NPDC090010 TaxID=3363942 RepID=UPI0037F872B8
MLRIGLTGGIASGKSLVATRLAEHGAVLIDSDVLARQVVEPGTPGLAAVRAAFGEGVIATDGSLDRAALGALVFAEPAQRARLNGIVHPLVREAAAQLVATSSPEAVVVQDIPLLVETGQQGDFDVIVVVDAPDEVRIARMMEHRGMAREDALARIAAQASREDRNAVAHVVLVNDGSREALLEQVDALWAKLRSKAAAE